MKLYIIGNGFDRNHGLKTSYWDYRGFLFNHYPRALNDFENCEYINLTNSDLWTCLEESLAIDYETCMDESVDNGYPDVSQDGESKWNEIEVDLDMQTKFIYDFTGKYLLEWLMSLDFSTLKRKFNLRANDLYLTFNYTTLLEELYNIPRDNILHIHGNIADVNVNNIFGQNYITNTSSLWQAEISETIPLYLINNDTVHKVIQFGATDNNSKDIGKWLENKYCDDDFYGVSIKPGIDKIIQYCDAASKTLKQNYNKLYSFISLNNIDEVIVMGHSYVGIDFDYYNDVIMPLLQPCKWTFYIHDDTDNLNAQCFINKFNLHKAQLVRW